MKLFAVLLGALALVAGFAGGVRAYSTSEHLGPAPVRPVAVPHYAKPQAVRPGPVFRYAPCTPPAHRVGRSCVTHVTRTVTLPPPTVTLAPTPAPAPRAAAVNRSASARPVGSSQPSDDGGGHHHGGHEHEGGDD